MGQNINFNGIIISCIWNESEDLQARIYLILNIINTTVLFK